MIYNFSDVAVNNSYDVMVQAKNICSAFIVDRPIFLISMAFILYLMQNFLLPYLPEKFFKIKDEYWGREDLDRIIFIFICISLMLSALFLYSGTIALR